MRKYAAPILAVIVTVLAFFLPEQLSRQDDSQLLNHPHIIDQGEGADFAQWSQLTIAEKLLQIRSKRVQRVSLPRDTVVEIQCVLRSGHLVPLSDSFTDDAADDTEAQALELWAQRMDLAYTELYKLQKAGAIPPLWSEGAVVTLKRNNQSLFVDRETQLSFPVYSLELLGPPYDIYLTIDSQSGRIMSAALAWSWRDLPRWPALHLNFWKDYWGMDGLEPELMDQVLRDLMQQPRDKEQSLTKELLFTYDDQTLRVPITRRDHSGSCTVIFWNYETPEIGGWQPMENLLGIAEEPRPTSNKGGH